MPDLVLASHLLQSPEANLTVSDETFVLHPKALLTASLERTWDEGEDPHADPTTGVIAGAEAMWSPVRHQRFSVEALGGGSWSAYDGRQDPVGSLRGEWRVLGSEWSGRAGGSAGMDAQDVVQAGRSYRRADLEAVGSLAYAGRDLSFGVTPRLRRERYIESGPFWTDDQRDADLASVATDAEWRQGSRLSWRMEAGGGTLVYRAAGTPYQDASFLRAAAGPVLGIGERTELTALVGAAHWRFADDFAGDASYGDASVATWEGSIRLRWAWREESDVGFDVRRQELPGLGSNAAVLSSARLSLANRFPGRWMCTVEGGPLVVANTAGPSPGDPEVRREWSAQTTVEYRLERGYVARFYVVGVRSRSLVGPDFSRVGGASQLIAVF